MPAVSIIVSALTGGVTSGLNAMAMEDDKDAIDEQKEQIREQAAADVKNIRERGARISASQNAALAASGVKLDDDGTGKALLAETKRLTEKDVLSTLTSSSNQVSLLNKQRSALVHSQQRILMSNILGMNSSASSVTSGVGQMMSSNRSSQAADQVTLDANSLYSNKIPKYSLLGGSSSDSSSLVGS